MGTWEPATSLIAQLIEAGQPFWLDIEDGRRSWSSAWD
jgi:hypothetical protein